MKKLLIASLVLAATASWAQSGAVESATVKAKALTDKANERLSMERRLRRAIERDEFLLHYQPLIRVSDRRIVGLEALVRWQHPQRGLLTARDFIHEIDGAGLTVPLAQWALQAAFRSALASESVRASPIAINVHPRLLQRPDFARNLMQSLRDDNIQPQQIALEITEQDFVRTADASPANIVALADAGIRVVIDDFGTGFSNFGYLTRFPVHAIKIDREFVAQIGINARSETLISALIGLAEELGIQTGQLLNFQEIAPKKFQAQIAFNLIPHIDDFQPNGYTKEEMKLVWETRKILSAPDIQVNATVVRVPVFYGHSEAVHIETRDKITAAQARALLENAPGVEVVDEHKAGAYPTPVTHASGNDPVYVGRIREDISHPRGLDLWVVSDNIRKGAALNAVQIAALL